MCICNLILVDGFVYEADQTLESRLLNDYIFTLCKTECLLCFVTNKFSCHGLD